MKYVVRNRKITDIQIPPALSSHYFFVPLLLKEDTKSKKEKETEKQTNTKYSKTQKIQRNRTHTTKRK